MKTDRIETQLRELCTLISGWKTSGRIAELERDLALEKLRRVYDAVRFGSAGEGDAAPEDGMPVEVPVNFDLDQVLQVTPTHGKVSGELESLMPTAMDGTVGKPFSVEEPVVVVQNVPAGPDIIPVVEIGDAASQPEQTLLSVDSAFPDPKHLAAVSEQTPAPRRAESAKPVEPVESHPVSGQPTVVEPVLFGLDEVVQHKRKQRVIMSLYDDRPGAGRSVDASVREPSGKPELESRPEPEPLGEEPTSVGAAAGMNSEDEFVSSSGPQPEIGDDPKREIASETACPQKEPVNDSVTDSSVPGSVLGEVINRGVQTLGETIAPARDAVSDMAHKTPVTDLRDAIGLNDKFLLIRDLFDGDAGACDAAIETLNGFADLDDCMIYIAENYAWNPNSDGARLLVELLERKLS